MTGAANSQSGMTILELVVALGILAGLLTMVAASIRPALPQPGNDAKQLVAFIATARTDAILDGQARLLHIGDGRIWTTGAELAGLSPALLAPLRRSAPGGTIVLYADGTVSAPVDAQALPDGAGV